MSVHNSEIAKEFDRLADLLEIKGENQFKVRSYRNAALTISGLAKNIAEIFEKEDIKELPGIGKSIAGKIKEYIETGHISKLEKLKKDIPGGLADLTGIGGLGPKKVRKLYDELGIANPDQLREAAVSGQIAGLEGFGTKTQEKILEDLKRFQQKEKNVRHKWIEAEDILNPLLDYLGKIKDVTKIEAAGSFRRKKETVGDIDILAICEKSQEIMNRFTGYEEVEKVIAKGITKSSVILKSGIQADLRVIPSESYGSVLVYFTGSKEHNVAMRKIAISKKLKINEYGVYKGNKRIAGKTEDEVYKSIGLKYIEPELRENMGEIEAAQKNKLSDLVTLHDIRGDLQNYTNATDGKYSLEEMVEAARQKGYEYMAITDHSKRVTMARGLDEKRLARQIKEIDKLNSSLKNFLIFKSVEVDILPDGSLDLSDDILKELDLVLCAIHYNQNLSMEKQTERVLKAMDNKYFNIFAHPTGRLIGEREPYEIDMEKIMQAAKSKGCYLEINANPSRLDLTEIHAKRAKEIGLKIAISTDAHSTGNLDYMRLGVYQARKGWLEKDDVLNTRTWNELKKLLKR